MTSARDFFDRLPALTEQMLHAGFRRSLVLAGDDQWSLSLVMQLRACLAGDWLWFGDNSPWENACPSQQIKNLLGHEYHHGVFDARQGFDAAGLAALSGSLKAGSWLVILAPSWRQWPSHPDQDSVRWSDSQQAISTPNFVRHVQRCLQQQNETVIWQQDQKLRLTALPDTPRWIPAKGGPLAEQQDILASLAQIDSGIAVITAGRGRGKSAVAGMLTHQVSGYCLVSAPAKHSVEVVRRYGRQDMRFIAPDQLIANPPSQVPEWLIIDEAAAIPVAMLKQMAALFPRVLLTTTVQGYEGTGRGFLLKLCAELPDVQRFSMTSAVRWADNDPLERLISQIMLFDEAEVQPIAPVTTDIEVISASVWQRHPDRLMAIYRLLCSAHYKTSPLDWRRMLDAPGQLWLATFVSKVCSAAVWLNEEGGLQRRLSYQVWAGIRRPRGNLVAQSLAARGSDPLAARLRGLRINRIAVHPSLQRQGRGLALVNHARHEAQGKYDYLSVSFGFTPQLWSFWQRADFHLVRLGSAKEANSGCYNAIAILPLSHAGQCLVEQESVAFRQDFVLHPRSWQEAFPCLNSLVSTGYHRALAPVVESQGASLTLTPDERLDLAGFAFAYRPLEACLRVLHRTLTLCPQGSLPLLEQHLAGRNNRLQSPLLDVPLGRKALLKALRREAGLALYLLSPEQAQPLAAFIERLFDLKLDVSREVNGQRPD